MNKFVASVGLIALGASGLQAAVPGLSPESQKPWSASLSLRGFYDDNPNTAPSGSNKQASFGYEISPSLAVYWASAQTHVTAGYVYSAKYYDHRLSGSTDKWDQTHIINAAVDHAFSERYSATVSDSFVIGQEPDVLRTGNAFTTFQRISGNNIRNYGDATFKAQLTRLLGLNVGYANAYYDYSDDNGNADSPSSSGLLDRIENTIHLDSLWTITPETIGVFGYQFRWVDYTGDEEIGITGNGQVIKSDNRNSREHYLYVGANHTFSPDLTGGLRVGGRYIEFYNDPTGNNDWGPYANLNLHYTYSPSGSYVEVGVTEDVSATDVAATSNNGFTQAQQTTVAYGTVHHQITPKLRGSLVGQFQNNSFIGGSVDGETEQDYLIGLNLAYQLTPHFFAETGYNFDRLDSDLPGRSFYRNRVYIGLTASY